MQTNGIMVQRACRLQQCLAPCSMHLTHQQKDDIRIAGGQRRATKANECQSHTTARPQITAPTATATLAMPGAHAASNWNSRAWRAPLFKPQAGQRTGLTLSLACAWRPSQCTTVVSTSALVRKRWFPTHCCQSPAQLACTTGLTLQGTAMHLCRRSSLKLTLGDVRRDDAARWRL